jgi:uncharacterized protein YjbJ (UPF0337 family)
MDGALGVMLQSDKPRARHFAQMLMPQERLNSLHVEPAIEERAMVDKDRVDGSAKNIGGKLKEGVGNVTGGSKMQTEGKADQAEGRIQNAIGGIKDSIKNAFKRH